VDCAGDTFWLKPKVFAFAFIISVLAVECAITAGLFLDAVLAQHLLVAFVL
jgi:hypothetical protein